MNLWPMDAGEKAEEERSVAVAYGEPDDGEDAMELEADGKGANNAGFSLDEALTVVVWKDWTPK